MIISKASVFLNGIWIKIKWFFKKTRRLKWQEVGCLHPLVRGSSNQTITQKWLSLTQYSLWHLEQVMQVLLPEFWTSKSQKVIREVVSLWSERRREGSKPKMRTRPSVLSVWPQEIDRIILIVVEGIMPESWRTGQGYPADRVKSHLVRRLSGIGLQDDSSWKMTIIMIRG